MNIGDFNVIEKFVVVLAISWIAVAITYSVMIEDASGIGFAITTGFYFYMLASWSYLERKVRTLTRMLELAGYGEERKL